MKKFICFSFLIIFLVLGITSVFSQSTVKHIVHKGETLYAISKKYNVTVDQLCVANKFAKDTVLKIGQVLIVPTTAEPVAIAKPKETLPQETDTYTVKAGDTLYSIAKRWDITVEILKILNQMSGTNIKVGQTLNVPQKTTVATKTDVKTSKDTSIAIEKIDPRVIDTKKTANASLVWPLKPIDISYVSGKVSGVLLTGKKQDDVTAIKEGTVMFSGIYRGFGQVVFVQSNNKLMYVYTGLESINVNKGDKIVFGESVGTLGIDIHSGKPQLNFMVFKDGKPIDPAKAPRG